jgi:hypothetical protein
MTAGSDGKSLSGARPGGLEEPLALERRLRLEAVKLALELAHVVELPVDGGESHVGDRVEVAKAPQRELADLLGAGHSAPRPQLRDDPIDDRLELVPLDRPFDRRPLEPGEQLRPVERLAPPRALANVERALVVALVGRETALAPTASAAAADGVLLAQPGVDDVCFEIATEWTAHWSILLGVVPKTTLTYSILWSEIAASGAPSAATRC